MIKFFLILVAGLNFSVSYSQTSEEKKKLIHKYNLPNNFFLPSYNAKLYLQDFYDSVSNAEGKTSVPPENLVSEASKIFLKNKQEEKAYWLLRMNLVNFPASYTLYNDMANYYKSKEDLGRAYVYFAKALTVKYKQPSIVSDSTVNLDSSLKHDYNFLSRQTGRLTKPPRYFVKTLSNNLMRAKQKDKAMALVKLNYEYYPSDWETIDDMSNYYDYLGDSVKALEYWAKATSIQYKLPSEFFDISFDQVNYLRSHYQLTNEVQGSRLPPETLVNSLGYIFIYGKMFDKAAQLFQLNISNYPNSENVFDSMADYYEATGNKAKEIEYRNESEKLKAKRPVTQNVLPQQVVADTTFDARVAVPVCSGNCPVILFDEAHQNYHTAAGRYRPFAKLMESDGFKVVRCQSPFSNELLENVNVVVIASLGFPGQIPLPVREIYVLNNWVRKGGSLFVITDHDNLAIDELLHSFSVETGEVVATTDSSHGRRMTDGTNNPSNILFSSKDKLLGSHPIIHGRNQLEKIQNVETYAGRVVVAPPGSKPLLILSNSSIDYMVVDPAQRIITREPIKTRGTRTHGVALEFGKGKVVVVGEAAMLTAQLWPPDFMPREEGLRSLSGDNKQFAINIMRWLTGYLK